MKKILFILPDLKYGGAQKNIVNIANNLSDKYICKIITVYNKKIEFDIKSNVQLDKLNFSKLRYSFFKLYSKIYNFSPDVIISSIGYTNLLAIILSLIIPKKIKVIIREANYLKVNLKNSKFYFINLIVYKYLYRFSYKIICTSYDMKIKLIDLLGKKIENKVNVINNFVDNEENIKKIRLITKTKNKKRLILTAIGRLHFQKGFDRLIKHFINFKYHDTLLLIIGEGKEKENLLKLIKKNKVKNIKILRAKKNILFWLFKSDYFVLSSRWEGMPNVVIEALDCGTKIIDFSNLKQMNELYSKLETSSYIKANFNKKLDDNMLIKKNIYQYNSLLPNYFKIDQNIKKLEKLINE